MSSSSKAFISSSVAPAALKTARIDFDLAGLAGASLGAITVPPGYLSRRDSELSAGSATWAITHCGERASELEQIATPERPLLRLAKSKEYYAPISGQVIQSTCIACPPSTFTIW